MITSPSPGIRDDPLPDEELQALVHLRLLPRLSDLRLRTLLAAHGSATAVLGLPAEKLGEATAAARESPRTLGWLERSLRVIEDLDVAVLCPAAPAYPERLRQLHDPPNVLFVRGDLALLERPTVAVVGARRHTAYGAEVTREIAGGLARAGVTVVSGVARGIDALAHEAALPNTAGVLGCGVDVDYPPSNRRLQQRIAGEGLLLSEFPPGTPPLPHHFPQRNRLIAALSLGVVVVEASDRSGSLITTEHALDLGREVFAVPGPIGRATSAGTNALIKDGARMVTAVGDILAELGLSPAQGAGAAPDGPELAPSGLGADTRKLWRALGPDPRHVDAVAVECGLSPGRALAAFLELELAGYARQLPGKQYVRAISAAPPR